MPALSCGFLGDPARPVASEFMWNEEKPVFVIRSIRAVCGPVVLKVLVLIAACYLAGCAQTPETPAAAIEPAAGACPDVEVPVCPEPRVVEKVVVKEVPAPLPPMATTAGEMHLPIVGGLEWVTIDPPGLRLRARMDTGLETSVIHADDIRLFEIDGDKIVSFFMLDAEGQPTGELKLPLKRTLLLKQPQGEPERRYVVRMAVTLGENRIPVEMALVDRAKFEHKVLLGRNLLVDTAIVDVSRRDLMPSASVAP